MSLQASQPLELYSTGNTDAFAAYRLPLLRWRDIKALKAERAQSAVEAAKGELCNTAAQGQV